MDFIITKREKSSIYKKLRKHMDSLPVGFPKTFSGVEIRILKYLFTPNEALLATFLDIEPKRLNTIFQKIPIDDKEKWNISSLEDLESKMEELCGKGLIFKTNKQNGIKYSNIPLVIGIFEFNLDNLTLPFLKDIEKYIKQAFAIELINSQIPQLRTIPIGDSIEPEFLIVPYDNYRKILNNTDGVITVAECICRKSYDINSTSCSHTDLRETCINIEEMGERYLELGIGRKITKEEALGIIKKAENDGLILQTMNAQKPQVICACCGDCCGTISILKRLPRPVDFSSSNYYCCTIPSNCVGCGKCIQSCQIKALSLKKDRISINLARCIGCGVCTTKCPKSALILKSKEKSFTPQDRMDLYHSIEKNKKTRWQKAQMLLKLIIAKENKKKNQIKKGNN